MNYESEVKKKYPDASYIHFGASSGKQHCIRLYTRILTGESLGEADNEQDAWKDAYEKLNS